jgi:hypothetical protein|eukprot:COSAG03_NODE_1703_length_3624_cov_23.613333_2_plen_198_part_00
MRVDWAHGRACDVKMNQHVYTGAHFSSNTLELPTRSGRWKHAWKQAVLQSSRREGPLVLLPKQVLLNAGTGLDPSVPVHAARAAQRPQPSDEHLRSARRSCSLSQPSRLRIECTRNRQVTPNAFGRLAHSFRRRIAKTMKISCRHMLRAKTLVQPRGCGQVLLWLSPCWSNTEKGRRARGGGKGGPTAWCACADRSS